MRKPELTPRQEEVLTLLAEDRPTLEVRDQLQINHSALMQMQNKLCRLLGCRTRVGLAVKAHRMGYVK